MTKIRRIFYQKFESCVSSLHSLFGVSSLLAVLFLSTMAFAGDGNILQWKEGDQKFQVLENTNGVFPLKGQGLADKSLGKDTADFLLASKGQIVKRASAGKNEWTIRDPKGAELAKIVFTSEGYELFVGGTKKSRIKLKDDKFNLYDNKDARVAHGKTKPDGYSVNYEGSGSGVDKIKGPKSLREASFITLPIGADDRILFWALERLP